VHKDSKEILWNNEDWLSDTDRRPRHWPQDSREIMRLLRIQRRRHPEGDFEELSKSPLGEFSLNIRFRLDLKDRTCFLEEVGILPTATSETFPRS
jgi:hypothetical protein